MVEIKIKGRREYVDDDLVGYVDKSKINFVGDMALVEADVYERISKDRRRFRYKSWGLIDRDFKEVEVPKTLAGDFLSFLGYSAEVCRVGERDFLISFDEGDEYTSRSIRQHIRIINGVPRTMDDDLGYCERTDVEHLIISDRAVYDVKKARHVTGRHSSIEVCPLDKDGEQTFLAADEVVVEKKPDKKPLKEELIDVVSFRLNEKNQIVSDIFSKVYNGAIVVKRESPFDYQEFLKEHRISLSEWAANVEDTKAKALEKKLSPQVKPKPQR